MKRCAKCGIEKDLNEFSKLERSLDGLMCRCRDCTREDKAKYYRENKDKVLRLGREFAKTPAAKVAKKIRNKKYQIANLARMKKHQKAMSKERSKNWRKRYYGNPNVRISTLQRGRIMSALKGKSKSASTINLLGGVDEARLHIESLFEPWMTWENHGSHWDLDHVKACGLFDLEDEAQQRECFHYSNLQPLSKTDHTVKTAKDIRMIREKQSVSKKEGRQGGCFISTAKPWLLL